MVLKTHFFIKNISLSLQKLCQYTDEASVKKAKYF